MIQTNNYRFKNEIVSSGFTFNFISFSLTNLTNILIKFSGVKTLESEVVIEVQLFKLLSSEEFFSILKSTKFPQVVDIDAATLPLPLIIPSADDVIVEFELLLTFIAVFMTILSV